jgi:DNA-binding response OmpR family regulator
MPDHRFQSPGPPAFSDVRWTGKALRAHRRPVALVADDEPLVRRLVCAVLAKQGWDTIEATDGAEALGLSIDDKIDLVITDHEMPAIMGLELANTIHRRTPELPILMISGLPELAQVAAECGCRFLMKPFLLDELVSVVATLTEQLVSARETGPAAAETVVSRAGGGARYRQS